MVALGAGSGEPIKNRVSCYDRMIPEVSIVILNYNKADLTGMCLRHIWTHTSGRRYEVVVIDNGSDASEFHRLSEIRGDFHLVRVPVNRFFGEGNNIGVQASRGKYIVFLNNDVFVTEGWLEPLIDVLEKEFRAGGVGPKFLYPGGRLQECGAFVDRNGRAIQRGKFYRMDPAELNETAIVDYCSAACFAVTRETLDRIGGFDASFEPAYYEDTDLCFKIASLDLFVYCCPRSVIYHVENATTATMGKRLGLEHIVEINREKFVSRWGDYLAAREADGSAVLPPLPPVRARAVAGARTGDPIAVFYTPYDLLPGGGERYLLTAASALSQSHRVFIASQDRYSDYRVDYMARELSLDLSGVSIIAHAELHTLPAIDVFFHLGNHQYPIVPPLGRRNFYMCQFPFPGNSQDFANLWNNLKGYDCILVNSGFTHDVMCSRINIFRHETRIEILAPPVPIDLLSASRAEKPDGSTQILSIGRFFAGGHNKRHDVLIEAMRGLTEIGLDAELHLVGALHPHSNHVMHFNALRRKAEGLPVHFHANATPSALRKLLLHSTIYWHATGYGINPKIEPEKCEHFGISVVEAMAFGCVPFVVANGGPCDFVREEDTGFQYNTIDELAAKTQALLLEPTLIADLSERAKQEANRFAESVFKDNWRKVVAA